MLARFVRVLPIIVALVLVVPKVAAADDPITITASDWKFAPATITLKVGVPRMLRLTSTEGVHGLQSDQLGLASTTIVPGKVTEVTVTPKKAGTYVLHCTIPCGSGHDTMTLTVNVEP